MQEQKKIKELFDHLTGYIDSKLELVKFDIKSDFSKIIIHLLYGVIILTLFSIIFFLLSFGFAEYLNHHYESIYIGYIILASIYVILLISVLLLKRFTNLTDHLIRYVMEFLDLKDE